MDTVQPVAGGTLLRRYRLAAGLTQEELAERAGISRRSLSDMERGIAHTPRKDTVALLADALGLSSQERSAFIEAVRRLGAVAVPAPARMSAPPFVGRAGELALLERHLRGEAAPLLLLAGEPGIGKTRLLHAAIPRAVAGGLQVLEGGCQRRGGQEPYAPLLGALQRHIRDRRPAALRTELRDCAWLVRLLPELADGPIPPVPPWTLTPEQERRLVHEAVVRFLANVAGSAGTLLLLDDLQWAGPDALDLLASLVRSASEAPLRIIGAYRDTEVRPQDALSIMLADLAAAGLVTHRLLDPLPPQHAEQLLDELWVGTDDRDSTLREGVLQRAGGVPFFLVSCAQALRQQDREEISATDVPWDVAHSVRQRVTALPEAARQILGVAAVIGRTVPHSLLGIVAARPEQELLAALEAACHAHLLEEAGDAAYRFAHDVIREVVEADLGAARRMLLHRDIAQGLESAAGKAQADDLPAEELAYHYARSDQPERALPYLMRAAERARASAAHQDEAALLAQAIDLAQRVGRDDLLAELHARRGKALSDLTRWAEARREMHIALEHLPPERGDRRAAILVDLAMASHWASDAAGTRRYAGEALSVAEQHGREELAVAALSALVVADSSDGELRAAVARYRQAAARAGDRYPAHLAHGVEHASIVLYYLAEFDEAIRRAREAVTLGRAAHDTSAVARALGDLGCALMGSGQYGPALQAFAEGEQFSRELGAINWLARSTAMRGGLHLELCDFGSAELLAEEARELSRSAQWINPVVSAGIDLILNFTRRGEVGRAEELVDEVAAGVAQGQGAHGWLWQLRFMQAQAEIALARGNHEQALRHAEEVITRSRARGRVKYEVAGLRVRAQALAALGRQREATVQLQAALARARGTGDPAMFLRPATSLLAIDGDDALLAESRAAVERIAGALPDAEIRERFLAAEPVRAIMH